MPILHTRSRTNSLVQSQTRPHIAVCQHPPMGSFVAQVPSVSDSLKALSQPSSPICPRAAHATPDDPFHKAWWRRIKRAHSRTPSINSIPALSRTHSPEPETSEPELQTPILRTPSSTSLSLLHPVIRPRRHSTPLHDIGPLPPLHPHLARPEKKSRLKKPIACSVCLKLGDDYPRCGKCGMAWCSRACRLNSFGQDPFTGNPLKKHIC